MDLEQTIKYYLQPLASNTAVRKLLSKPPVDFKGKFHGYSRNKTELRKLYEKSGWEILKETSTSPYNYVAILG